MTLAQAMTAPRSYRLAHASLACVRTDDDFLAWAARFVPWAAGLPESDKAPLKKAMVAAGENVGLERRDVIAIVEEALLASAPGEEER